MPEVKGHPFFKNINWLKIFEKKVKPPYLPEYNVISLEDIKSNGCNIVNFFVSDDFDHYLKEFKNLSLSINFFKISIYYLKLFEMLNKSNGICKLV